MKLKHKLILLATFLFTSTVRLVAQVQSTEVLQKMQSEKNTWFSIINIVIEIVLFGGLVYIIAALVSKREANKGIVVAWFVALLIWGIGSSLLSKN